MIDFNHHTGQAIADSIICNLNEKRELQVIESLNPKFSKDGNQFCYLYGEDLQSGIAGFGDTVQLAVTDFCKNFWSEKIE